MRPLALIILFLCSNCWVTAQISHIYNGIRSGDEIVKQQVAYKDPGRAGDHVIWDFSELHAVNPEYKLAYDLPRVVQDTLYILGRDTFYVKDFPNGELLVGTEHSTMYYYRIADDRLLLLGYENPLNLFRYTFPVVSAAYSLKSGQKLSGNYRSEGLYSGKEEMQSEGMFCIEDDARGMLILPSGDTLSDVTRQKMVRTAKTPVRINTSGNAGQKSEDLCLEFENYKWYVRGYRYPVFETSRSFTVRDTVRTQTFATAFFYPPQEHYYLDEDEMNLALADSIRNQKISNREPNVPDTPGKGLSALVYNFFPNPVVTALNIEYLLKSDSDISIALYDASGKILTELSYPGKQSGFYVDKLDCSVYPTGDYILRFRIDGEVVSEKIFKR